MSQEIQGLRILLADDDRDALELFTFVLTAHGARVVAVGCAAEALDVLRRDEFDVLVSDLRMPGLDGFELVRRLRRFDPELPALALSACTSADEKESAFEAGFDAHVCKPVSPTALLEAIATLSAGQTASR
jgi:CheY-like chemotaxis protein